VDGRAFPLAASCFCGFLCRVGHTSACHTTTEPHCAWELVQLHGTPFQAGMQDVARVRYEIRSEILGFGLRPDRAVEAAVLSSCRRGTGTECNNVLIPASISGRCSVHTDQGSSVLILSRDCLLHQIGRLWLAFSHAVRHQGASRLGWHGQMQAAGSRWTCGFGLWYTHEA
jgi:hypothetical protein